MNNPKTILIKHLRQSGEVIPNWLCEITVNAMREYAQKVAQYIGECRLYQEKGKGDAWYNDDDGLFVNNTESLLIHIHDFDSKQDDEYMNDCGCPDCLCMSKDGVKCHYENRIC
jgi:hypothetical protein